jgi:hypothetical protein
MTEILRDYGFFILVAILMLCCHMSHGGHRRRGPDGRSDEKADGNGHGH